MPNTISLKTAQDQLTAATAAVDQLKAKLLNEGPGSVTAEELGQAALAVEHSRLTLAHATKQAEETAAAERLDNLQLLKLEFLERAGDREKARTGLQMIAEGTAILAEIGANRQSLVSQGVAALQRAGVPQASEGQADQHAGLAWSEANAFTAAALHIDGRRISHITTGALVGAGIVRGCKAAGTNVARALGPIPTTAVINDPDAWINSKI